MVREPISNMKNGKAALEMVKTTGEAWVYIITDLVNQILAEAIPAKWGLL